MAIREHLNDARAALDAGDRSRALTAINAALALDPEYLAAQTLKERIEHEPAPSRVDASDRATPGPLWPPSATDSTIPQPSARRARNVAGTEAPAPPPVVSAEGWARFEQRARARRLERRVAAARVAIQKRRFIAARAVLDEIREIDPDHPDLISLGMELDAGQHIGRARARRWGLALIAAGLFGGLLLGARYLELPVGLPSFLTASNVPTQIPQPAQGPPEQPDRSAPAVDVSSEPPPAAPQGSPEAGNLDTPAPIGIERDPVASTPGNVEAETAREAAVRPVAAPPARATDPLVRGVSDTPAAAPPVTAATTGRIELPAVLGPTAQTVPAAPPAVNPAVLPGSLPTDRTDQLIARPAAPIPEVSAARAAIPAVPAAVPRDEDLIRRTLGQYRAAYDNLDARSAQAVWPRVDEDALQRAFSGLQSQQLTFDDCQVQVRGVMGSASCRGTMLYVPKVGSRDPRREPRVWTFALRKVGDDWQIDTARIDR